MGKREGNDELIGKREGQRKWRINGSKNGLEREKTGRKQKKRVKF